MSIFLLAVNNVDNTNVTGEYYSNTLASLRTTNKRLIKYEYVQIRIICSADLIPIFIYFNLNISLFPLAFNGEQDVSKYSAYYYSNCNTGKSYIN